MLRKICQGLLLISLLFIFVDSRKYCGAWSNEFSLFKSVNETISSRRDIISHLTSHLQQYLEALPPKKEKSLYLGNLANNFVLVRRLVKVWPPLLLLMNTFDLGNEIKPPVYPLESADLWQSALTGLVRLQETYDVATETIANGQLPGSFPKSYLTAEDCFDVSFYYLRQLTHPSRAVEWLLAATTRVKRDSFVSTTTILEHLYMAYCLKGDLKATSLTVKSLQEISPSFELSSSFQERFNLNSTTCKEIAEEVNDSLNNLEYEEVHNTKYQKGLCRRVHIPQEVTSHLRCRLLDYHRPHLLIQPVKMEELYLDPPVLMFHDVIYDNEIETLIQRYRNRTRYAGKADYDSPQSTYQDTQYNVYISKDTDVDGLDEKLSKRAARIANLNVDRADKSNLASYGIGGELKLHRDLSSHDFNASLTGDYATVLYYLTDHQDGGLTIFPDLNLSIAPVKGNALFFFDRWPDLTYIDELVHSGCPILRGSKWIITKWLHAVGQNYPECGLKERKSYKHYYLE